MRLFKHKSGIYYVEKSKNFWRSLKTEDKRLAQSIYRDLKKEALKRRLIKFRRGSKTTLGDFRDKFRDILRDSSSSTRFAFLRLF